MRGPNETKKAHEKKKTKKIGNVDENRRLIQTVRERQTEEREEEGHNIGQYWRGGKRSPTPKGTERTPR